MHGHVIANQQISTKKISQKLKNPKKYPKPKTQVTKMHECMKEVEKGGLERLTNKLRLGVVQNLEGMKDFGEEERFGLREMRERD